MEKQNISSNSFRNWFGKFDAVALTLAAIVGMYYQVKSKFPADVIGEMHYYQTCPKYTKDFEDKMIDSFSKINLKNLGKKIVNADYIKPSDYKSLYELKIK